MTERLDINKSLMKSNFLDKYNLDHSKWNSDSKTNYYQD